MLLSLDSSTNNLVTNQNLVMNSALTPLMASRQTPLAQHATNYQSLP
jgi:hypothetical protein